jgi:GDP-4-dehydro-6-deoxy-D-mannose reductase
VKISIEQDLSRLRPTDLRQVIGSADRARNVLAWSTEHGFEDTIAEVLNDWRARVRNNS